MHTYYGIWIDHSKAFIIKSNKLAEMEIRGFGSEVESHHRGGNDDEHVTIANQHRYEERRSNEMKAFSREVITHLSDADEIVIFGPGTAKHAFQNELETHKALSTKIKGLETTDQLSEAEMKDFVKDFFKLPAA